MDFKMFSKARLFNFSQWYLHFQLLLGVSFYPSELSSMKWLANHLALSFVEMIQMLPILYGILGLSHWMRRHHHFQLCEFVGNSAVSCPKLKSGGPLATKGRFFGGRLVPSLKKNIYYIYILYIYIETSWKLQTDWESGITKFVHNGKKVNVFKWVWTQHWTLEPQVWRDHVSSLQESNHCQPIPWICGSAAFWLQAFPMLRESISWESQEVNI